MVFDSQQVLTQAALSLQFHQRALFALTNPFLKWRASILDLTVNDFMKACHYPKKKDFVELGEPLLRNLFLYLLEMAVTGKDLAKDWIEIRKINDPSRGPLNGQDGVFSKRQLSKWTVLCEYGGLLDLESDHQKRVIQMEKPNSEEKTVLLSSSIDWPVFQRATASDEMGDRLVLDGYFHSNICSKFNDFRKDPFKIKLRKAQEEKEKDAPLEKPNCRLVEVTIFGWPYIFAVTEVDCESEIELTIDYGEPFWEALRFQGFFNDYMRLAREQGPDVTKLFSLLSKL